MINHDEVGMAYGGHDWLWRPGLMKQLYDRVLETFAVVGIEPNRLGAKAPGVNSRKYGTFAGKRRHLERADFDEVDRYEVSHLLPGGCFPCYEWSLNWSVNRAPSKLIACILPSALPHVSETVASAFRSSAAVSRLQYGYCFHQVMKYAPLAYFAGLTMYVPDDTRSRDLTMNGSWWGQAIHESKRCPPGMLRGIYPESYLSQPYLDAPIGRTSTTLKQWIEADQTHRGTLERYTDILTKWTPPVERIPHIREELYRAGRVHYWRFFCPEHRNPENWSEKIPEPLYRPDLTAPWEAPDPIPEIYRADYWKDKDPSLTY